ncbi:MAG: hypothetical protein AAF789_13970, partial [Bacteroidota bacterium]
MKRTVILNVLLGGILVACGSDEDENRTLSPENAAAEIELTLNGANQDIISMLETDGMQAIISFLGLFEEIDQFAGRQEHRSWIKEKLVGIEQIFVSGPSNRLSSQDQFDFQSITGVFKWSEGSSDFIRTSDSDSLIVFFPSEGSDENNTVLTISDLAFETFSVEEEFDIFTIEVPTSIVGNVVLNDVEVVSVDISASWSTDGFPDKANLNVTLSEFSYSLTLDDQASLNTSLSASISKANADLMAVDINIEFESTDKE